MKKVFFIGGLICLLLFSSCENFMNSSSLKKEIGEIVKLNTQENPFAVTTTYPKFDQKGVCKDQNVIISFNKPLDSSKFDFKVTSSTGLDFTDYYKKGTIEYLEDSYTLKIKPNSEYSRDFSQNFCDLTFTIFSSTSDSESFKLGKDYSWQFRITRESDNTPPSIITFNVAKTKDDAIFGIDLLSSNADYTTWTTDDNGEFYTNHLNSVWVYAKVYDEVSEPNYIRYSVSPIKYLDGEEYSGPKNTIGYYTEFSESSDGYAEVLFECDFDQLASSMNSPLSGLDQTTRKKLNLSNSFADTCNMFSLDFLIYDNNGNTTPVTRTIIYDKQAPDISELEISTTLNPFSNVINNTGNYTFYIAEDVVDKWFDGDYSTRKSLSKLNIKLLDANNKEIPDVKYDYIDSMEFATLPMYLNGKDFHHLTVDQYENLCIGNYSGSNLSGLYLDKSTIKQSGMIKCTIPNVSTIEGLLFNLSISDEFNNESLINLGIPGAPIYLGLGKDYYEGQNRVMEGIVKYRITVDSPSFFVINIIKSISEVNSNWITRYMYTKPNYVKVNLQAPDEVNFDALQQVACFNFSDTSHAFFSGYEFDREITEQTVTNEDEDKYIKDISLIESQKNSGVIKLNIDYDFINNPNSYVNVWIWDKDKETPPKNPTQFCFSNILELPADGCYKYRFGVCNHYSDKPDILTDYANGEYFTFTDDNTYIDNKPPVIEELGNGFFYDNFKTLKTLKNMDINPLGYTGDDNLKYVQYNYCVSDTMLDENQVFTKSIQAYAAREANGSYTYFELPFSILDFTKTNYFYVQTFDTEGNFAKNEKVIYFDEAKLDSNVIELSEDNDIIWTIEVTDEELKIDPTNLMKTNFCKVRDLEYFSNSVWNNINIFDKIYEEETIFLSQKEATETITIKEINSNCFYRFNYMNVINNFDNIDCIYRQVIYKYSNPSINESWTAPDFIAGSSFNKINVITNQPVFVHTLFSTKDYGDNIQAWEALGMEANPTVISSDDYYAVLNPYANNSIYQDYKYCKVIGHAADGTIIQTKTKIKK